MLPIIKDLFNYKNYIKAVKSPKKIGNFFKRFNYYPGLKFANTRSQLYKNFEIFMSVSFARNNKQLKKNFFLSSKHNKENVNNYYFENTQDFKNECYESLIHNGAIVLENFLNDLDYQNILKLVDKNLNSDLSKKKIFDPPHTRRIVCDINLDDIPTFDFLSKNVTKQIYGKIINPSVSIIKTIPKNIPEHDFPGDNNLHPDRYLPNLKIFYFPFEVNEKSGPFKFALGSHKISKEYLDFFKHNKDFIFDDRNIKAKQFLKNVKNFVVKKNSVVIALTNGFHGRKKFEIMKDRVHLMFTYPQYTFLSMLN